MAGGYAVSAVAHAVRDHRRARRPLVAPVRVSLVKALVIITATGRVSRLTAGTVRENSEHYRKPSIERSFRVAARTIAPYK